MLRSLVEKHGPKKWSTIASHINGRIGKQCRERWLNHLSPDVSKDVWTEEEDEILINAQFQMGNKWSFISKLLPGRSENAVKNRYNSIASRNGVRKKRLGTYVNRSAARSNLLRIPVQSKTDSPSEGISPRRVSPFPRCVVSSTSFDSTYSELLKKASEGARAPSARHSRRGGDAAQPAKPPVTRSHGALGMGMGMGMGMEEWVYRGTVSVEPPPLPTSPVAPMAPMESRGSRGSRGIMGQMGPMVPMESVKSADIMALMVPMVPMVPLVSTAPWAPWAPWAPRDRRASWASPGFPGFPGNPGRFWTWRAVRSRWTRWIRFTPRCRWTRRRATAPICRPSSRSARICSRSTRCCSQECDPRGAMTSRTPSWGTSRPTSTADWTTRIRSSPRRRAARSWPPSSPPRPSRPRFRRCGYDRTRAWGRSIMGCMRRGIANRRGREGR